MKDSIPAAEFHKCVDRLGGLAMAYQIPLNDYEVLLSGIRDGKLVMVKSVSDGTVLAVFEDCNLEDFD
jgi:hypothetical protein